MQDDNIDVNFTCFEYYAKRYFPCRQIGYIFIENVYAQ